MSRRARRGQRITGWSEGLVRRLSDRRNLMMAEAEAVQRGTRLRALPMATAATAALAVMFAMVAQNVLAVNFTSANTPHQVYTDRINGTDAAAYLKAQPLNDGQEALAQFGFNQATLNGLCLVAQQEIGGIGRVSMMVIAGEKVDGTVEGSDEISADQLFFASKDLTGQGDQIAKLTLGQSADTLGMGSYQGDWLDGGTPGAFGLQAQTMNISHLDGESYGVDLQGQINLPKLRIKVLPGAKDQSDCAAQY
ncbi:hypothetical protein BHE97_12845 [Aeromicrobium sp. PE09-221]|uniref:DUF6230 family protein n=1 Tax=Aeromicrobium sp. PE09-221 TaxID=1898043 RepID=UPI000B3E99A7|nr:DUF6230 family protein [Aeromicrobium sp. PE09-221]OUZ08561.1 hypothetical protein BHE97_12845 [Aeromicrobium sp. PE09-221]